jgi:hypothetical protein
MFLMTNEARAQQAAELEKKRKAKEEPQERRRPPLHAMAEGEAEYEEEQRRKWEAAKARHPESGRFVPDQRHPYITDGHASDSSGNVPATPRPMTSWPGSDARSVPVKDFRLTRVGDSTAAMPEPQMRVHDLHGGDHPERAMHFGLSQLNHLDPGGRPHIIGPLPIPVQPAEHIAPTSPRSTQ